MLELNLKCESVEEMRSYLNGPEYLNLLSDLMQSLRNAQKHGTDADVLSVVTSFYPDICRAVGHSDGPY
jgi:hypothetical protein